MMLIATLWHRLKASIVRWRARGGNYYVETSMPNGSIMVDAYIAAPKMLLDEHGNRSIFDDVDE